MRHYWHLLGSTLYSSGFFGGVRAAHGYFYCCVMLLLFLFLCFVSNVVCAHGLSFFFIATSLFNNVYLDSTQIVPDSCMANGKKHGRIQDIKLGVVKLKKCRRAERGANIFSG